MSNPPPNGYTVRLVYYGRATLKKEVRVKDGYEDESGNIHETQYEDQIQTPRVSTQNVRIIAFPGEDVDYIGVYELVKNEGATD